MIARFSSGVLLLAFALVAQAQIGERLTSRPAPAEPAVAREEVGQQIRTAAGQRRRLRLPDGSLLYVNENTVARLEDARTLALSAGEVYAEAATALVVKTAGRALSGRGASFAVRVERKGPALDVTRGQVEVPGLARAVRAGEQLAAGGSEPAPLPRASHALPWLRELMTAALVPASPHAGGALVAIDPNGQEAKLNLRRCHIDVHIEDGFARTTIDQTYFNHANEQLEGTFYFPLPPDASLSRLAMYVNGDLMEGGMAEREHAREVYETIRYARRDPALLEWVDGSTFKMRVFPLEPRQEKRILLSYTQRLPALHGKAAYRFPAGHSLQQVGEWSVRVRLQRGAQRQWSSPSHTLKAQPVGNDLVLEATQKNVRTDRDVVLYVAEPDGDLVRFATFEQDGARYLLVCHRPELTVRTAVERRDWVFLVETSADREPLLARAQIEIVRHLLQQAGPDDTFALLAAGTRVHAFASEPQPVTPENVQAAVSFLEGAHLIGALDLGHALAEAAALLRKGQAPHLVHLGSGIAAMGERRHDALAAQLPAGTCYLGIGVGKRWARDFMKATAERTGGLFTQINPDEPIAWRAFELVATVNTPRLLDVQVLDRDGRATFLAFTQSASQGEELAAVTRVEGNDPLPATVVVRGTLEGKPFERTLPVRNVRPGAGYLPRTWAKLEIDRLLAEDPVKHKERIVALSKAMYVITPFTSLLVLEHEDLYTQYKVDRGRKDHWALYPAPAKIPVVTEPDPNQADLREANARGLRPARQVLPTVVVRGQPNSDDNPVTFTPGQAERVRVLAIPGAVDPQEAVGIKLAAHQESGIFDIFAPDRVSGRGQYSTFVPATIPPEPRASQLSLARDHMESGGRDRNKAQENLNMPIGFRFERAKAIDDPVAIRGFMDLDGSLVGRPRTFLRKAPPAPRKAGLVKIGGVANARFLEQNMKSAMPEADSENSRLLYARPTYNPESNVFHDLVAYAPGLNTSPADIEAVLASEALPSASDRAGQLDAGARELLRGARIHGWHTLTAEGYTIHFDADGRFTSERTLPSGLRERVVCDGKELLHVYPQLALAARREYSRFHRAELIEQVPWLLPPAEDLARGADLRLVDPRTIAIVPHGASKQAEHHRTHLVFADGRLAERQVVRMPKGEVVLRQVLSAQGTVRLLDGKSKELAVRQGKLNPAAAPSLAVDTKDLLVLPLPYRTAGHVRQVLNFAGKSHQELRLAEALPLLLAEFAAGNGAQVNAIFRQALHAREQRQLGYYVLLAACGLNLDTENSDVVAEHPDAPLAQYLALHTSPVLRKQAAQWAVSSIAWQDDLLRHLAVTHALLQRWRDDRLLRGDPARVAADRQRALEYVRKHKDSPFGWSLLCLLQDRAGTTPALNEELIALWSLFEDAPGLGYAARYEHARTLLRAGRAAEARDHFRALHAATLKAGELPGLDQDFRAALLAGADAWSGLMLQTARQLIEQKHRPAVLLLARQCAQLEDGVLAGQLLNLTLEGLSDAKERAALTLAGVHFLRETGQLVDADRLLQSLLDEAEQARRPELWRLAAELAGQRDMTARALECLEKALNLESRNLPEVVDLQNVRADYGKLLEHYQQLADAMLALKLAPPADFAARVIRTADRWRALDSEATQACQSAARILRRLGDRDLGWDYLTTPVALQPNEAQPWATLAAELGRQGDLDLAERAHRAACEAEPTNAQLLWDRAHNLRQAGKPREAQALFRRIAEGSWQPRFQALQAQARYQLQGR